MVLEAPGAARVPPACASSQHAIGSPTRPCPPTMAGKLVPGPIQAAATVAAAAAAVAAAVLEREEQNRKGAEQESGPIRFQDHPFQKCSCEGLCQGDNI
jgi:hypothetical protein